MSDKWAWDQKSVVSDLTLSDEGTREQNIHNFVCKVIYLERSI